MIDIFNTRKCNGPAEVCQESGNRSFSLHVVSLKPRAFHIPNFISDFECDAIIQHAVPKIRLSSVGHGDNAFNSSGRTSENTWIGREVSDVTETIYRRASHLLNLDEKLLNSDANAEEMQVTLFLRFPRYIL